MTEDLDIVDVGGVLGGTSENHTNTVEPASSVTSDSLSEQEYSSDSGKGYSSSVSETLTPPASVNGTETIVTQWPGHLCTAYSPYTAYSKSVGKMIPNQAMIYEFEIPQSIVGRLIGRFGSFVNKIKIFTGANIIVKRHPSGGGLKICAVEGICSEIDKAIAMIRERFPAKKFPNLTLEQAKSYNNEIPPPVSYLPSNNKLNLSEGVVNDVAISSVVNLDHIFVQQPTHPTYPSLSRQRLLLNTLYSQPGGAPKLTVPFTVGVICVAQTSDDEWSRVEVVAKDDETSEVTAHLVDVGDYIQVPIDSLRQIRMDFLSIPFQATACRLGNVTPINEETGWSEKAVDCFKNLCQGQVIQANVVGYSSLDNITLVHLYKLSDNHSHVFINKELVNAGHAKWIDEAEYYALQEGLGGEINDLCGYFNETTTLTSELASLENGVSFATDKSNLDNQEGFHDIDTPVNSNVSQVTEKEPCSSNLEKTKTKK